MDIKKGNERFKLIIFLVVIIFVIGGYFVYKSSIKLSPEEEKEIINNLNGTWHLSTTSDESDDYYIIYDIVFTFDKEGNCTQNGDFKIIHKSDDGSSTSIVHNKCHYLFNSSFTKIRLEEVEGDDTLFSNDYYNFKIDGDNLTIGNMTLVRVK